MTPRYRCEAHEDMARRLASVETNTGTILQIVQRLEDRIFTSHGITSQHTGIGIAVAKTMGLVIAATAAAVAVVKVLG